MLLSYFARSSLEAVLMAKPAAGLPAQLILQGCLVVLERPALPRFGQRRGRCCSALMVPGKEAFQLPDSRFPAAISTQQRANLATQSSIFRSK